MCARFFISFYLRQYNLTLATNPEHPMIFKNQISCDLCSRTSEKHAKQRVERVSRNWTTVN